MAAPRGSWSGWCRMAGVPFRFLFGRSVPQQYPPTSVIASSALILARSMAAWTARWGPSVSVGVAPCPAQGRCKEFGPCGSWNMACVYRSAPDAESASPPRAILAIQHKKRIPSSSDTSHSFEGSWRSRLRPWEGKRRHRAAGVAPAPGSAACRSHPDWQKPKLRRYSILQTPARVGSRSSPPRA